MLVKDFSVEMTEVGGVPLQSFKKRFQSVREMFCKSISGHADKIFLVEGQEGLTYREIGNRVSRMAAYLRENVQVQGGEHVGILMENSVTFVITFFAIQTLGAVAVVLNNRLSIPELERQMTASDTKKLLSSPLFFEKIKGIRSVQHFVLGPSWESYVYGSCLDFPPSTIHEDDVALILFTSGTGGMPKGVMVTNRNLITRGLKEGCYFSQYVGLKEIENSKTIIAAPLFHALALGLLMTSVFLGITSFIVPSFTPDEILNIISREGVDIFSGTPTMYWMLLHKTEVPMCDLQLKSLKLITYGGAPMPPDLMKELRETFPGVKFINGYGLTEASFSTILHDNFCEGRPTSIGQPTLCCEVKIVNPFGIEMEAHGIGELIVRGSHVTKGYYKMEKETAEVFRNGWVYTGDMGYKDAEGFIYLVGRTREMINRGGENVYPVEVENILHLHPKILDIAVFGIPDPVLGEIVGCAIVPLSGDEGITLSEIQAFCRNQLADYKIPQKMLLVPDLPRNPGGKVIKEKIIEKFL